MDVQCYIGPGWVVPPCAEMGALGIGPVPSTLSREPVPGKLWDAQWKGVGGEGVRAGSLTGLGVLFGVGGSAPSR